MSFYDVWSCHTNQFRGYVPHAFIHAKIGPPKGGRSADHGEKKKTLPITNKKKTSEHFKALCQNKYGVVLCSLQEMIALKSAQWIFYKTCLLT